MKLRLNLLPYRDARRQKMAQNILAAWMGTFFLGAAIIYFVDAAVSDRILQQRIAQNRNKATIAELDEKLGEINNIKELKQQIKTRLGIIKTLGLQRNMPVFLLEAISEAIPEKIWLTEISTTGNSLSITGNTVSNSMVADFMRQLDSSPYISAVVLNNITQVLSTDKVSDKLRRFKLGATIVVQTSAKKQAAATVDKPTIAVGSGGG